MARIMLPYIEDPAQTAKAVSYTHLDVYKRQVQGRFEEAQADARLLGRNVAIAVEVEKFTQKVPVHARASPKKQYRIDFDAAAPFSCPRGGARKFDVGRRVDGRGGAWYDRGGGVRDGRDGKATAGKGT